MSNDIYEHKQQWIERVMASELTPAQKVFAYSIFRRCFGDKLESFPSTQMIEQDTYLARSKFSAHRKALFGCGALTGVKNRRARGRQQNYTYSINLDWDGRVPSGSKSSPIGDDRVSSGSSQVPIGSSNTSK